ncbi:MAG: diaminopimelate decarboxylase [Peptostreptococcus sp.]|uniref:diaminopimelate decarboxylase n=1 Tax=Peptostreptococcus sp. TaxID=1262 RepID=UPI002FCAAA72
MQLHGTAKIESNGHLSIGGVDTLTLVDKYSTPLFVYDEKLVRDQCRRFHSILSKSGLDYHISYASKAFICKHLLRVMTDENMGLDVVSMGELYNALAANFDPQMIHFHGNNKTEEEINMALKENIGCFVIDSFDEIEKLDSLAKKMSKKPNCLLRVTPGVEAHTHDFITTGNTDSKFGLNIDNGQAFDAIEKILNKDNLNLLGVHFHIGSQIFGTDGTRAAIEKVFAWFAKLKSELKFSPKVLNIGGGFGIRYTEEDTSYPIEDALEEIIETLKSSSLKHSIDIPQLWLEPGRSIIGEAGYTLYTVGTIKEIPNVRNYVSIDGGMSDHIRTALYGAKYEVALANKMLDEATDLVTIAGKCCESGDMIAYDVNIPRAQIGDVAVVSCTGAYHYSMASNYNQMTKPAVVFVKDGSDQLAIRRESLEDLIKNQL